MIKCANTQRIYTSTSANLCSVAYLIHADTEPRKLIHTLLKTQRPFNMLKITTMSSCICAIVKHLVNCNERIVWNSWNKKWFWVVIQYFTFKERHNVMTRNCKWTAKFTKKKSNYICLYMLINNEKKAKNSKCSRLCLYWVHRLSLKQMKQNFWEYNSMAFHNFFETNTKWSVFSALMLKLIRSIMISKAALLKQYSLWSSAEDSKLHRRLMTAKQDRVNSLRAKQRRYCSGTVDRTQSGKWSGQRGLTVQCDWKTRHTGVEMIHWRTQLHTQAGSVQLTTKCRTCHNSVAWIIIALIIWTKLDSALVPTPGVSDHLNFGRLDQKWCGIKIWISRLILIWISTGLLSKCSGFIPSPVSVISQSFMI